MPKLTFVCFDMNRETVCAKCYKTIKGSHHRGIWFPDKPFEPNGEGRGYVYALCMKCHNEVVDKKTKMPSKAWLLIFEDGIKELLVIQKSLRLKVDTSGMSEEEVFDEQMLLLTGRRKKGVN